MFVKLQEKTLRCGQSWLRTGPITDFSVTAKLHPLLYQEECDSKTSSSLIPRRMWLTENLLLMVTE
jgi:hypothetical protein